MGIDHAEDPEMFLLTVTNPTFSETAKEKTKKIATEGHSFANTLFNMQRQRGRLLVMGQVRTIVFSEEAARSGLMHRMLRDVDQQRDMNPNVYLVIIEGATAQDVIYLEPLEEARVAEYLTELLERNFESGHVPRITASRYWFRYSSHGLDPVVPVISLTGESGENRGLMISGLAALDSQGRMQGLFTEQEGVLLMLITGQNRRSSFTSQLYFEGDHREISLLVEKATSKIRPSIEGGRARIAIQLFLDVDVIDVEMPLDALEQQVMKKIGSALAIDIQGNMLEMIKKSQDWGTDCFGLGQFVRIQHPQWFRSKEWSDEYCNSHITLEVKVNVRRIGALTNPQY